MSGARGRSRRCGEGRAGAVLLEVVIAVAMLLMAAITITGAVNQGVRVMERLRLELRAADLARTAMAEMEAGIATPERLNGPVRAEEAGEGFADAPPEETGWELEVSVSPAEFAGLAEVGVRAVKRSAGGGEEASYSLRQLVRLGAAAEDRAGTEGGLNAAGREGGGR